MSLVDGWLEAAAAHAARGDIEREHECLREASRCMAPVRRIERQPYAVSLERSRRNAEDARRDDQARHDRMWR